MERSNKINMGKVFTQARLLAFGKDFFGRRQLGKGSFRLGSLCKTCLEAVLKWVQQAK